MTSQPVKPTGNWREALIFVLAAAGIVGVVLAFNINLARYKLLLGQLSALSLFGAYLVSVLFREPANAYDWVGLFNRYDLLLVLFLVAGLTSYFFLGSEFKDAGWTTWFKFFIYGSLYWSLSHGLKSHRLTRKLIDLWLGVTIVLCIYGISQYYQVDFFFLFRPTERLFQNAGVFGGDFYVSLMIFGVGLFWGVVLYFHRGRLVDHLSLLLLFMVSYYILVNHFGPIFNKELADKRIFSTYGNANMYSAYLVLVALVGFGLLAESVYLKNTVRVWFYFPVLLLILINLALTQTRAGYIAVTMGFIIFAFLFIYSLEGDLAQKTRLFGISVGVFILVCILLVGVVKATQPELFTKAVEIAYRRTARVYVWLGAVRMMSAHPLLGGGIGTFAVLYPDFRPAELDIYHPKNLYFVRHAHNEFLEIGAEQGLLGLGLFLGFLYVFFRSSAKVLNREHPQRFMLMGLLAGIGALMLNALVSVDMRFVSSAYFFWMSVAFTSILAQSETAQSVTVGAGGAKQKRKAVPGINPLINLGRWAGVLLLLLWLGFNVGNLIRPFKANQNLKKQDKFFNREKSKDQLLIRELEEKKLAGGMSARDYFKLGNLYAKDSVWLKAISNLEEAVRINPELFGALNNLGNIAFMHRRVDDAVKFYRQAVVSLAKKPELTPREVKEINDARFNLGFAYFKQGDLNKALEQFNAVLKDDPNHAKALKMRERLIE